MDQIHEESPSPDDSDFLADVIAFIEESFSLQDHDPEEVLYRDPAEPGKDHALFTDWLPALKELEEGLLSCPEEFFSTLSHIVEILVRPMIARRSDLPQVVPERLRQAFPDYTLMSDEFAKINMQDNSNLRILHRRILDLSDSARAPTDPMSKTLASGQDESPYVLKKGKDNLWEITWEGNTETIRAGKGMLAVFWIIRSRPKDVDPILLSELVEGGQTEEMKSLLRPTSRIDRLQDLYASAPGKGLGRNGMGPKLERKLAAEAIREAELEVAAVEDPEEKETKKKAIGAYKRMIRNRFREETEFQAGLTRLKGGLRKNIKNAIKKIESQHRRLYEDLSQNIDTKVFRYTGAIDWNTPDPPSK